MNLSEGLAQLAGDLGIQATELVEAVKEDHIGGFNFDVNERKWRTGSIWEVEGQVLFALVRVLKPKSVLEIGTWAGCGASHILEALTLNGGKGKLTSVDIDASMGYDIPYSLRKRWEIKVGRGQDFIQSGELGQIDLVFEDASHDEVETTEILQTIKDNLKPRLVISHDGMHYIVGHAVQQAYANVYGAYRTMLIEPADCGFAYVVPSYEP